MVWNLYEQYAREGDLVQLVGLRHKHFLFRLQPGKEFQSHRGKIQHDEMIGLSWGSQVFSHNGSPFFLLQPALADILSEMKRNTQIMYPKEIGYILVKMGIGPGHTVLEAGTGSGSLTTALAYSVGPNGRVISYEVRPQMQKLAIKNLDQLGLSERVTFKLRDIGSGFDETGVQAVFLDVPNPHDYILHVRNTLQPGGFFGCILPTTNQVSNVLRAFRQHQFAFVEVSEVLLRYYKPEADRLRPVDRMVAHTGFLVFARSVQMREFDDNAGNDFETSVESNSHYHDEDDGDD